MAAGFGNSIGSAYAGGELFIANYYPQQYAQLQGAYIQSPPPRVIRNYWRINHKVDICEGENCPSNPVDKLRLKVSMWLNNN